MTEPAAHVEVLVWSSRPVFFDLVAGPARLPTLMTHSMRG